MLQQQQRGAGTSNPEFGELLSLGREYGHMGGVPGRFPSVFSLRGPRGLSARAGKLKPPGSTWNSEKGRLLPDECLSRSPSREGAQERDPLAMHFQTMLSQECAEPELSVPLRPLSTAEGSNLALWPCGVTITCLCRLTPLPPIPRDPVPGKPLLAVLCIPV